MSSKDAKDSKPQNDDPAADEVAAEVLFDDWGDDDTQHEASSEEKSPDPSPKEPTEPEAEPEPEPEAEAEADVEASVEERVEEPEPEPEPEAEASGGFSIVDLIIQEQLEKNALVLAPQEEKENDAEEESAEPESEDGAEEQPEPEPEVVAKAEPEPESEDVAEDEPEPEPEVVVEPEPEPEIVAEAEPEPEEEEEEDSDEWELTPEELAELAELEAELEDNEATEESEEIPEESTSEAVSEESDEESVLEEQGQPEEDVVEVAEAEPEAEPEPEPEEISEAPETDSTETEAPSFTPDLASDPVPAATVLLGASTDTIDETDFTPEPDQMLLGPAAAEVSDDLFKPADPEPSIWEQLTEPAQSAPTEPTPSSDISSAETLTTAPVEQTQDSETMTLILNDIESEKLEEIQAKAAATDEAPSAPTADLSKAKPDRQVGGQLRDMEKVLTETVKDKLPWGIKKRALPAMKFLSKLSGIQRGMVIAATTGGVLECVASGGVEGDKSLDYAPMRLFKFVFRSKEPLILLDGEKDPRFSNDKQLQELGIKSSLCVPFKDCESGADGLLYVDNLEKTNAFTYQDLRAVKEFAKKMSTDYQLGEPEPVEPPKAPQEFVAEQQPTDPRIFVLAAIAALVLIFPALSNPTVDEPEAEVTPISSVRVTSDPRTVVLSFIRAIETRNAKSAYKFLSPEQQQKVEPENFEKRVLAFAGKGNNAWVLSRLSLVEDSKSFGKNKRYTLVRPDSEKSSWKISVKEDSHGSWYVSKILGMSDLSI